MWKKIWGIRQERVGMEKKIVSADVVPDIPLSNENELHKLNLRSYKFCMAQYFIQ